MPVYEYKCVECKEKFEFMQKISDEPKVECPDCGGKLKKAVSLGSFSLKGKGWYKTDYSNKKSSGEGTASSCQSCESGSCG